MTLREALQIEIWSKQTSRRILKCVGTCLAVGGLVAGVNFEWITPPERKAARVALAAVEELQQKIVAGEDEYEKCKENADQAVERAQEMIWTSRDRKVANAVYGYSVLIEMQHDELKRRPMIHEFYEKHPQSLHTQSHKEQEAQQDQLAQQVDGFMHDVLHRALD